MTEDKSSLLKALHAVQAKAPTLRKDATGQVGSRHYKYTPLDTIVETLKPLLEEHGLVWVTKPGGTHEAPTLHYTLYSAHSEPDKIMGEMPLMISGDATSQALGSAITYARRYALCAVLNLVADDDDDGQAAQSYGKAPQRASRVPSRSTHYSAEADSGKPATKPQKGKVRGEATRAGIKGEAQWLAFTIAALGAREGIPVEHLTFDQASFLIDRLQQGAIPTGESDVPAHTDGFQESLEGGDPVPWEDEK